MSTYDVAWNMAGDAAHGVERYCPNCGKQVLFTDSGKVRRNANGKDIYAFAIYKCPRDHTWNRRIEGDPLLAPGRQKQGPAGPPEELPGLEQLRRQGYTELRITVTGTASERLDRALAARFAELSRTGWQRRIEDGFVTVDGRVVKAGYVVKEESVIVVRL